MKYSANLLLLLSFSVLTACTRQLPFQPEVLIYEGNRAVATYAFEGNELRSDSAGTWNVKIDKAKQIGAYCKVDRDPRGRTISVAYLAIVERPLEVSGQDDAAKAKWFPVNALPPLAFDHDEIMADAMTKYAQLKP